MERETKLSNEKKFQSGEHVAWQSSQGIVEGTEKKLTRPTDIKAHHVAASPENPEYLVKSDETGAKAAHKPGSLEKK